MQLWDSWGGNNQKWVTIGNGWISTSGPINTPPRCLDADLSTIGANGTKVQLWDCFTPTTPNQNWWSPSEGGWAIKVLQSGRCLDADLGTIVNNGTIVQLWDCLSGNQNQNQTWRIDPSGAIVNLQSHRCLDADLGSIGTNGTKVQLWDCLGGQNQNWNWPGFAPGSGISGSAIANGQSQQCLDADLGTIGANGTKVQLWACFGGPPQNQFWVNPLMD
jgi:hypothetical protein